MDTRLLIKLRKEAKHNVKVRRRYFEMFEIGSRNQSFEYIGGVERLKFLIKKELLLNLMLQRARREYILTKTKIIREKRNKKIAKQLYKQCRKL